MQEAPASLSPEPWAQGSLSFCLELPLSHTAPTAGSICGAVGEGRLLGGPLEPGKPEWGFKTEKGWIKQSQTNMRRGEGQKEKIKLKKRRGGEKREKKAKRKEGEEKGR